MKRTLRNLLVLALATAALNQVIAQKGVYTTNSGMTIGFGLGGSYQQSDIANSRGAGFDFTLGSHLYKKESAFLAVDWKFRFLAGENRAHDHRMNVDTTYNNIKFDFFTYDLELGLTLNRLRERTRIVITGFAGAGITHGRTFTDLYDANGDLYDYTVINPNQGRSLVYADLLSLSDNDYETQLVNKATIMPTLGVYIGYQLSRSFFLGIEHKTNFSLTEHNSIVGIDLDNKVLPRSMKDMNHYTTLGFKWILGGRSNRSYGRSTYSGMNTTTTTTTRPPVTRERPVINPAQVVNVPPPVVVITVPAGNTYSTSSGRYDISARVQNVRSRQDIRVLLNGTNIPFEYNPGTGIVTSSLTLADGTNSLAITGVNTSGSARDDAAIIYSRPARSAPPRVRFISPPAPVTVEKNVFGISAQTVNVRAWQDVTVTINGISTSNFAFSNEGMVTINIGLKEGANIVEVSGKNESGSATERTTITCTIPVKPETLIVNTVTPVTVPDKPAGSSQETKPCPIPVLSLSVVAINRADATHEMKGTVRNVKNRSDIKITVNGSPFDGFQFVPNTGAISADFKFNPGSYTIMVSVKNECGDDSETSTVVMKEETACGVRINPGNSPWQFCLVTPDGTFNRESLENNNFSYSGPATSLFFMSIAGGGDATVNGKPYSMRSGQYYLFTGNITVTVSTKDPGSMGQWSVCIIVDKVPAYGNGNNRPKSPCEEVREESVSKRPLTPKKQ